MKKLISLCLMLCLAVSLAACGGNSSSPAASSGSQASTAGSVAAESASQAAPVNATSLRFATDSSEDYVSTVQIYRFAKDVEEKTEGRIKIEVYAGAQLGDEKACVEQVQMGSLDFTKSSMGALTSFNSDLTVLSMPYLFKSPEHMWAVMNSDIGSNLLASMESSKLIGLGWLDAGSRCFYSTKPIEGPEDMKGLKVRVMESPIYTSMISSMGGSPIAMAGSDVYSALQTGVVDAAENNIPRIIDMSHNELCSNLILDRHNIMPEMVIAGKATWDKLDAADQKIIQDCVATLQSSMIVAWNETETAVLETLKDGGMTVVEPSAETIAAFREAMQPVYDEYGQQYADLIQQIEATSY